MNSSLKNWSLPIKTRLINKITQGALCCFLCFSFLHNSAQIANYVNNGGFEECENCTTWVGIGPLYARHWDAIDTTKTKLSYLLFSVLPPGQQAPNIGFAWQYPRSGNNYILGGLYLNPNTTQNKRLYARNRMKQNLQAGKTYCVKFYWSITNQSSVGVDGLGAYFGDSSLDTISKCNDPITYLIPQVQNPSGNMLTDTLNWVLMTGTFTANGSEKYMVLGNFKSDAATNTVLINPANLPTHATDILYDDVSVIDIDLPAFAGYDYYQAPGDSAFIGRTPDVGINEACTWFQLPNMAVPIATVAGLYVKPSVTATYVVRQEICGIVKWDTVVVFQSGVGLKDQGSMMNDLKLYPMPAQDELVVQWNSELPEKEFTKAEVLNSLGQLCLQRDLDYENRQAGIPVRILPSGLYTLRLKGSNSYLNKRFLIER